MIRISKKTLGIIGVVTGICGILVREYVIGIVMLVWGAFDLIDCARKGY